MTNPLRNFRLYRKLFNRRSWIKVHRENQPRWVRRWEIEPTDLKSGTWERGTGRRRQEESDSIPLPQDT